MRDLFRGPALAGLALLLIAAFAFTAAPPPSPEPKATTRTPATPEGTADALNYVFLGSNQPVLLRVHVRVGGRAYDAAWRDFMNRYFAWIDRNNDGVLTPDEANNRLPMTNFLVNHLQGSIGGGFGGQTVPFAELDTNKDGKVTPEEFADYYRRTGLAPLDFRLSPQADQTRKVTAALYSRLDPGREGRLTKEKLLRGWAALRKLDENEDETISVAELHPEQGETIVYFEEERGMGPRRARDADFLEVRAGEGAAVGKAILTRYDRNKDGFLDPKEAGLDKAVFDALDANKDGKLDARELAKFIDRDPDLALIARVGQSGSTAASVVSGITGFFGRPTGPKRLEVFNPKKAAMTLAAKLKSVDAQASSFEVGDTRFEVQVNDDNSRRFDGSRSFYLEQFNRIEEGKGYVDRKQEAENAGNPFLFQIFTLADRDGNGRLTRQELRGYLDMMSEGSGCTVVLEVRDQGRSLFDLLDANGDGRLSMRELRTAWDRLEPFTSEGRGLAESDIPRQIQVSLGQGSTFFRRRPMPTVRPGKPASPAPTGPAPLWFTKMDRNSDGDVSRKEFLGTAEEFAAIDTDGDGLISAEEARALEAKRSKTGAK